MSTSQWFTTSNTAPSWTSLPNASTTAATTMIPPWTTTGPNTTSCVYSLLDECELTILISTILLPVTIVIAVLGVIANGLVIGVIVAYREMRTIPSVYIANLAITDIMFLIFVGGSNSYEFFLGAYQWETSGDMALNVLFYYMELVCAMATVLMLTALTMDRYLAIVYPLKSQKYRSKKLSVVACICVWIFSFAISGIYFGAPIKENQIEIWTEPLARYLVSFGTVFIYVIPLIIMYFCYGAILRVIWKRRLTDARATAETRHRRMRQKYAVLRASFLVVALFTLVNGAYQAVFLWIAFGGSRAADPAVVVVTFTVVQTLLQLNGLINPFLYALSHETFYHHIWTLLRCRCRRHKTFKPAEQHVNTVSTNGGVVNKQNSWKSQGVYNMAYDNVNHDEESTRL